MAAPPGCRRGMPPACRALKKHNPQIYEPALEFLADYLRAKWPRVKDWPNIRTAYAAACARGPHLAGQARVGRLVRFFPTRPGRHYWE